MFSVLVIFNNQEIACVKLANVIDLRVGFSGNPVQWLYWMLSITVFMLEPNKFLLFLYFFFIAIASYYICSNTTQQAVVINGNKPRQFDEELGLPWI